MNIAYPSLRARVIGSVLIAFHMAAIIIAPWSAPPSSPLAQTAARPFQPYLQAGYLNHGYHFFAPEPGPSHLVRYELKMPGGSVKSGRFPDLAEHQPRLLYHRHFMLTEFLNQIPPDEKSAEQWRTQPEWPLQQLSAGQRQLARGYADHLLNKHGAASVKLYLVRHHFPSPIDVQKGMKLDDASLYQEKSLGTFTRNES
ncbi:MAG: hypothetical protein SGJ19_20880 [Planctomycetia bacterium]|nr:hypothetical protein [Planctomycetia bacterium]